MDALQTRRRLAGVVPVCAILRAVNRTGLALLVYIFTAGWLLVSCSAGGGTPPQIVSGPQGPAAVTASPLSFTISAPGAASCGWTLSGTAGPVDSGACQRADGAFSCTVPLPGPGLYRVTFDTGAASVGVAGLDYRPRYGGSYPPDLDDGSSGITSGWGAWGGSTVADPLVHEYPRLGVVTIYRPEVLPAARPAVFFVSGWGRDAATYDRLFRFLASKGFVVFDVYNEDPGNITSTYPNALFMLDDAVNRHAAWVDTSRVGLMGHSMGGGMAFWLAVRIFGDYGWGSAGRFIFVTAPWYTFLTTRADLERIPADTRVIMQTYQEDLFTDPDVYELVYRLLPTPPPEKDFVYVRSASVSGYDYHANHYTSYTGAMTQWDPVHYEPYDLLDVYALNRPLDALTAYVFDGEQAAREVALGGGSPAQVEMGPLPPLTVTDDPDFHDPAVSYDYVCRDDNDEGWDDLDIWMLADECP